MISVGGKDYITLKDDFYVNGKKVYEASVNGGVVYPRHVGGRFAKIWGRTRANCRFIYSDNVPWSYSGLGDSEWFIHDSGIVDYSYSAGFVIVLGSNNNKDFYIDNFYDPLGKVVGGEKHRYQGNSNDRVYNGYPLYHNNYLSYMNSSPVAYDIDSGKALMDGLTVYTKRPYRLNDINVYQYAIVYKNDNGFPHAPDYYRCSYGAGKYTRIEPKNRENFSLPMESGRIYRNGDGRGFTFDNQWNRVKSYFDNWANPVMGSGYYPVSDRISFSTSISCGVTETYLDGSATQDRTIETGGIKFATIPIQRVEFYDEQARIDDYDIAYLQSV